MKPKVGDIVKHNRPESTNAHLMEVGTWTVSSNTSRIGTPLVTDGERVLSVPWYCMKIVRGRVLKTPPIIPETVVRGGKILNGGQT